MDVTQPVLSADPSATARPAEAGPAAAATPPAPLPLERPRIESIDVLRGFALLGILIVNIQSFSMIEAAYFNPTAYGDLTGANYAVWLATHLLADQKMMTIFSMLFGAGIVLMASGREATGRSPAAAHYRRMLVLLGFGMLHAYLIWYGDILVSYALCGLVAYPFRRARPGVLLTVGLVLVGVASAIWILSGLSMRHWPADAVEQLANDMAPPPQSVQQELAIYRGGWMRQMEHRVPASLYFQTFVFLMWGLWRALGLMLIGMGLFKLGVFSAQRTTRFYATLVAAGLFVGLPVVLLGVRRNFDSGWDPGYTTFFGAQYNYWASILVSLGWVGVVMLVCRAGQRWAAVTGPLAAVGRLAFTNYLLQSILCTLIFYGHGLGLFGRVSRVGQLGVVLGVWALQLALSPLWLRHFRMGPAEWLWRCLTYLEPPPMRRAAPVAAPSHAPAS
jgi:uncharacterized protein